MSCVNVMRTLLSSRPASYLARQLHTAAPCLALAKKTSAAGGVMGLGKGKKGKMGKLGAMEKKELPVETDPQRLISYVCGSNIYITGEDVKIGPDAAYPPWLWELRTAAPPGLHELDPSTKAYWLKVRAAGMRRNNRLRALRKF